MILNRGRGNLSSISVFARKWVIYHVCKPALKRVLKAMCVLIAKHMGAKVTMAGLIPPEISREGDRLKEWLAKFTEEMHGLLDEFRLERTVAPLRLNDELTDIRTILSS